MSPVGASGRDGPIARTGHAGLEQGERPVLEVRRGVRVGEDVGELLES